MNEFGSMTDFYWRLKNGQITFEEAKSWLMRFNGLVHMLANKAAHKNIYKEKKAAVLKNAELLLEGLKLIYSRFVAGILDHDNTDRPGAEESFSEKYSDEAMDTSDYDFPF